MRALVTGAAGFIGGRISARLLADGHEVVGIDALTDYYDPRVKLANLDRLAGSRFRFVEADLNAVDLGALLDGVPLRRMCDTPGMPDRETVRRWRSTDAEFDRVFRAAQHQGWITLAEQVAEDVDAALEAGVNVRRVRLMLDVRRWLLTRQAPEFFGSGRARERRRQARAT